jgi:predicted benzoate:H+ symporter BenE
MVAATAQLTAAAVICAFLISVSRSAGLFLDEITFLGYSWAYDPVFPKSFFLFVPMLPFFFICQVLFPKHAVLPIMVFSIISVTVFASSAEYLLTMSPLGIALLQLVGWLPFVALIRHYCYFWDLNLNGR